MQPPYSKKIFPSRLGILMLVLISIASCQASPTSQPSPTPNLLSTEVSKQLTKVALLVTPNPNETDPGKLTETVTSADDIHPLPDVATANGIQISLEQVEELESGYILKGRISKVPGLWLMVLLGEGTQLLDAQGGVIPTQYYYEGKGGTIHDTFENWGLQTIGKEYPSPWSLAIPSFLVELSRKVSFAVDLGPEPQIGQVWELNTQLDYAGHTLIVQKMELFQSEKNKPCLKFSFAGGPEIFRVTSVNDPENRARGKDIQVGDANSGEIFHSSCYAQMPVGIRRIDIYSVDVIQQGPWTLRWQPPNENASVTQTTPPVLTTIQSTVISDPATVIKNCEEVLATFNSRLKTTGWIRTVYTIVYFDNIQKEYRDPRVMEQWYRLDPDGLLVEGYNWISTPDGAVEQETLFQSGIWYNVTLGGSSHSINTKVDFTSGIVDGLKNGEKITQEAVRYHDKDAWRFFFEFNDGGLRMARAMFFDRDAGVLTGNETYAVQPDGSLQLVSGAIYSSFEINADPPLDRFQQILEKAQKMH